MFQTDFRTTEKGQNPTDSTIKSLYRSSLNDSTYSAASINNEWGKSSKQTDLSTTDKNGSSIPHFAPAYLSEAVLPSDRTEPSYFAYEGFNNSIGAALNFIGKKERQQDIGVSARSVSSHMLPNLENRQHHRRFSSVQTKTSRSTKIVQNLRRSTLPSFSFFCKSSADCRTCTLVFVQTQENFFFQMDGQNEINVPLEKSDKKYRFALTEEHRNVQRYLESTGSISCPSQKDTERKKKTHAASEISVPVLHLHLVPLLLECCYDAACERSSEPFESLKNSKMVYAAENALRPGSHCNPCHWPKWAETSAVQTSLKCLIVKKKHLERETVKFQLAVMLVLLRSVSAEYTNLPKNRANSDVAVSKPPQLQLSAVKNRALILTAYTKPDKQLLSQIFLGLNQRSGNNPELLNSFTCTTLNVKISEFFTFQNQIQVLLETVKCDNKLN